MIRNFISVTSHALDPLPLSQTVTHSWTPCPLERDILYGRPLRWVLYFGAFTLNSIHCNSKALCKLLNKIQNTKAFKRFKFLSIFPNTAVATEFAFSVAASVEFEPCSRP